jgi:hypothetical protein
MAYAYGIFHKPSEQMLPLPDGSIWGILQPAPITHIWHIRVNGCRHRVVLRDGSTMVKVDSWSNPRSRRSSKPSQAAIFSSCSSSSTRCLDPRFTQPISRTQNQERLMTRSSPIEIGKLLLSMWYLFGVKYLLRTPSNSYPLIIMRVLIHSII